jgi:hypothetical protein
MCSQTMLGVLTKESALIQLPPFPAGLVTREDTHLVRCPRTGGPAASLGVRAPGVVPSAPCTIGFILSLFFLLLPGATQTVFLLACYSANVQIPQGEKGTIPTAVSLPSYFILIFETRKKCSVLKCSFPLCTMLMPST